MAEWKVVTTAPDDELVLVWGKKGFSVAIYTHEDGWEAETLHGREQMEPPEFWTPLPEKPR